MSLGQGSKTGEGALTTVSASGGYRSGNLGENFVQELLTALAVVTPAGRQPPRLEGRPLTKDNIRAFIREYEHCNQMIRSANGEMRGNPVGVMEPLGWSQRRVIKDIHSD